MPDSKIAYVYLQSTSPLTSISTAQGIDLLNDTSDKILVGTCGFAQLRFTILNQISIAAQPPIFTFTNHNFTKITT